MSAASLNRKFHRWGAIITLVPVAIVLVSGIFLQFKKESSWIQPPTARGTSGDPTIGFDEILRAASTVEEAEITTWEDVDRLDVRPSKGIVKVRGKNRWEVQVDAVTGAVVQTAFRRSDLIETIHDGSWFHAKAKLWVFLPCAVILFALWCTGAYLWVLPHLTRRRRRQKGVSGKIRSAQPTNQPRTRASL